MTDQLTPPTPQGTGQLAAPRPRTVDPQATEASWSAQVPQPQDRTDPYGQRIPGTGYGIERLRGQDSQPFVAPDWATRLLYHKPDWGTYTPAADAGSAQQGFPVRAQVDLLGNDGLRGVFGAQQPQDANPLLVGLGGQPGDQRGGDYHGIATAPITLANFATYGREGALALLTSALGIDYQQPTTPGQAPTPKDPVTQALTTVGDMVQAPFNAAHDWYFNSNNFNRGKQVRQLAQSGQSTPFLLDWVVASLFPQGQDKYSYQKMAEEASRRGLDIVGMLSSAYDLAPEAVSRILNNPNMSDQELGKLTDGQPISLDPVVTMANEAAFFIGTLAAGSIVTGGIAGAAGMSIAGIRGAELSDEAFNALMAANRGIPSFAKGMDVLSGALKGTSVERAVTSSAGLLAGAQKINAMNTAAGWSIRGAEWGIKQLGIIAGNQAVVQAADNLLWQMPLSMNPGLNILDGFRTHVWKPGTIGRIITGRPNGETFAGVGRGEGLIGGIGVDTTGRYLQVGGKTLRFSTDSPEALAVGRLEQMTPDQMHAAVFAKAGITRDMMEMAYGDGAKTGLTWDDMRNQLLGIALQVVRDELGPRARYVGMDEATLAGRSEAFVNRYLPDALKVIEKQVTGQSNKMSDAIKGQFWRLADLNDSEFAIVKKRLQDTFIPEVGWADFVSYNKTSNTVRDAIAEGRLQETAVPRYRRSVNLDYLSNFMDHLAQTYPEGTDVVSPKDVALLKSYGGAIEQVGLGKRLAFRKARRTFTRADLETIIGDVTGIERKRLSDLQDPRAQAAAYREGRPAQPGLDPFEDQRILGVSPSQMESIRIAREQPPESLVAPPPPGILRTVAKDLGRSADELRALPPAEAWDEVFRWMDDALQRAQETSFTRDQVTAFAQHLDSVTMDPALAREASSALGSIRDEVMNPLTDEARGRLPGPAARWDQARSRAGALAGEMDAHLADPRRALRTVKSGEQTWAVPANIPADSMLELDRLARVIAQDTRNVSDGDRALLNSDAHPLTKLEKVIENTTPANADEIARVLGIAGLAEPGSIDAAFGDLRAALKADESVPRSDLLAEAGARADAYAQDARDIAGEATTVATAFKTVHGTMSPEVAASVARAEVYGERLAKTTKGKSRFNVNSEYLDPASAEQRAVERSQPRVAQREQQLAKAQREAQAAQDALDNIAAGTGDLTWNRVARVVTGKDAEKRVKAQTVADETASLTGKPTRVLKIKGGYEVVVGDRTPPPPEPVVPTPVVAPAQTMSLDEIRAFDNSLYGAIDEGVVDQLAGFEGAKITAGVKDATDEWLAAVHDYSAARLDQVESQGNIGKPSEDPRVGVIALLRDRITIIEKEQARRAAGEPVPAEPQQATSAAPAPAEPQPAPEPPAPQEAAVAAEAPPAVVQQPQTPIPPEVAQRWQAQGVDVATPGVTTPDGSKAVTPADFERPLEHSPQDYTAALLRVVKEEYRQRPKGANETWKKDVQIAQKSADRHALGPIVETGDPAHPYGFTNEKGQMSTFLSEKNARGRRTQLLNEEARHAKLARQALEERFGKGVDPTTLDPSQWTFKATVTKDTFGNAGADIAWEGGPSTPSTPSLTTATPQGAGALPGGPAAAPDTTLARTPYVGRTVDERAVLHHLPDDLRAQLETFDTATQARFVRDVTRDVMRDMGPAPSMMPVDQAARATWEEAAASRLRSLVQPSESKPPVYGAETRFQDPRTETRRTVPATFKVVEASDLSTSWHEGYPQDLQPRVVDAGRDATVAKMAKAPDERALSNVDPTTGDSGSGSEGAPVVGQDGTVLAGNHRARMLQVADQPAYDAYRAMLTSRAAEYGIAPADIAAMDRPVLVREVGPGYMTSEMARALNQRTGGMGITELASSISHEITPEDLAKLELGDKTTLSDALTNVGNSEFVRRIVGKLTEVQQQEYTDSSGKLNIQGRNLVTAAVISKVLGTANIGTVSRLVEATDGEMGYIGKGITEAAGQIAVAERQTPGLIGNTLADAAALALDAKGRKLTPEELDRFLNGEGLAVVQNDPMVAGLARALLGTRSSTEVATMLRAYADAIPQIDPNQIGMFGDAAVPPLHVLINAGIDRINAIRNEKAGGSMFGAEELPRIPDPSGVTTHGFSDGAGNLAVAHQVPVIDTPEAAISVQLGETPRHYEGDDLGMIAREEANWSRPVSIRMRSAREAADLRAYLEGGDTYSDVTRVQQDGTTIGNAADAPPEWQALRSLASDREITILDPVAPVPQVDAAVIANLPIVVDPAFVETHGFEPDMNPDVAAVKALSDAGIHTVVAPGDPLTQAVAQTAIGAPRVRTGDIIAFNEPDLATQMRIATAARDAAQQRVEQARTALEQTRERVGTAPESHALDQATKDLWDRYYGPGVHPYTLGDVMSAMESIDYGTPPATAMSTAEIATLRGSLLAAFHNRLDELGAQRLPNGAPEDQPRVTPNRWRDPSRMTQNDQMGEDLRAVTDEIQRRSSEADAPPLDGWEGTQYEVVRAPRTHDTAGRPLPPRILPGDYLGRLDERWPGIALEMATGRKRSFGARIGDWRAAQLLGSAWDTAVGSRPQQLIARQARDRFIEGLMRYLPDGEHTPRQLADMEHEILGLVNHIHQQMVEHSSGWGPGRFQIPKYRSMGMVPQDLFEKWSMDYFKDSQPHWLKPLLDEAAAKGQKYPIAEVWRSADNRVREWFRQHDTPVSAWVESMYGGAQSLHARGSGLSVGYNLYRFALDVRYIALELSDAAMLTLGKEGPAAVLDARKMGKDAKAGKPIKMPLAFGADDLAQQRTSWAWWLSVMDTGGWNRAREHYIISNMIRTQMREFPDIVRKAAEQSPDLKAAIDQFDHGDSMAYLDRLSQDMHTMSEQGRYVGAETVKSMLQPYLDRGVITPKEFEESVQRGFWTDMPQLEHEIAHAASPELVPLLERLHYINQQTWADNAQMIFGQVDRSNLQRLMNSPLLYWPISYQIKATKWLASLMFERALGYDTGGLGAVTLGQMHDKYRDYMAKDPAFGSTIAGNSQLLFFAQMLLPITPWDIGVSLSPFTRLALSTLTGDGSYSRNLFGVGPGYTFFSLLPKTLYEQSKAGSFAQSIPILGTIVDRAQAAFPYTIPIAATHSGVDANQQVQTPTQIPPLQPDQPSHFGVP